MNKKRKIKLYSGLGALITTSGLLVGLKLYDNTIDHLHEYCPLNNILGVQHQINNIKLNNINYGIDAVAMKNGKMTLASTYPTHFDGKIYTYSNDSSITYIANENSVLIDNTEYTTIKVDDVDDAIIIVKGYPVYPDGAAADDYIKVDDIKIYQPKIINVLEKKPRKTIM